MYKLLEGWCIRVRLVKLLQELHKALAGLTDDFSSVFDSSLQQAKADEAT